MIVKSLKIVLITGLSFTAVIFTSNDLTTLLLLAVAFTSIVTIPFAFGIGVIVKLLSLIETVAIDISLEIAV